MFHKTRKKIVISIMAALMLFLGVTLAVIYGSSYLALKLQNEEMLERYVSIYSLENQPGENLPGIPSGENEAPADHSGEPEDGLPELPPGAEGGFSPDESREKLSELSGKPGEAPQDLPPDVGELYRLSSFYSVAFSSDGSILAEDTGRNGIYTREELEILAGKVLAAGRSSGLLDRLLFRVDERESYTLVAFMDMTQTDNSMGMVFVNTLAAGIAAILIFSVLSVFLARKIVRPLEENDRRQRQFVSDAGHELKTPIAVVGANAELLERQIGHNQWLSNIQYENERMGKLTREMLELSRSENGRQTFEEIDLSALAEREVLPFESVAFERGLLIRSHFEEGVRVQGSPRQLGQLISILTDNAISHASGGKYIDIELKRERRQAVFSVANPGESLSEEARAHLFDRFYRCDESRGEGEGHFGLGLPIARAIVDAHRGKIQAKSLDGKVIFTVTLPAE